LGRGFYEIGGKRPSRLSLKVVDSILLFVTSGATTNAQMTFVPSNILSTLKHILNESFKGDKTLRKQLQFLLGQMLLELMLLGEMSKTIDA
jgi:hypothetical protein